MHRLMLLEGKKLPSQLDNSVERGTDDGGDPDREVPMSTSERAIQKEAKLIAEKEKEKGKMERAKDEKAEPRKNGQVVEKQVKVLPNSARLQTKDVKHEAKKAPQQVNGKINVKTEPKDASSSSSSLSSSSSSSSSSSMALDDLLNIQKDLLHIETDETWEMPVIQSVTSVVKQEADQEQEQHEELPIVKVEPGLSKNLRRIESEILAETTKNSEPEFLLDPATGTMKKAVKRKSSDTTLKVPEKVVRKNQPDPAMKYITQKVKLKKGIGKGDEKTGQSEEESESVKSLRKSKKEETKNTKVQKAGSKIRKTARTRSTSEEGERGVSKNRTGLDNKCITQKVKLKKEDKDKAKVNSNRKETPSSDDESEGDEEKQCRYDVDTKCISRKVKLKRGIGKEENCTTDETSNNISERPRRNTVPVKYENFDMKQEPLDDYPQDNDGDDTSDDDDDDDFDEAEEMEGSAKDKAYCICKSAYNKNQPMIGCDGPCQDWYHFGCVGIPQNFRSIADWYCESCFYKLTKGSTKVGRPQNKLCIHTSLSKMLLQICLCDSEFEAAHELVR